MAPWPYAPSKFGQSQTPTYGGITSGYTQSTIWVVAPTMSYPDSYAVSKRKLETHLQSLRRRREVVHGPPPVVLELCTLPMPEKTVRSGSLAHTADSGNDVHFGPSSSARTARE